MQYTDKIDKAQEVACKALERMDKEGLAPKPDNFELWYAYYSDANPEEILENNAEFLGEVGITQHLSPNRRNGLSRIIDSIQHFAKSCQAES